MKVNPSIFKAYDVRGKYPDELNEDIAYLIGRALPQYLHAKTIAVGRDARLSSPSLFEALQKGITSASVEVVNLGEVPTEGIYFAVGQYNYDAGVMITASHLEKDYNGFKFVRKGVRDLRGKEIWPLVEALAAKEGGDLSQAKMGEVKNLDIWPGYLKHVFSFIELDKVKPIKIVVDAGNGMAGKVVPLLAEKLPAIKIVPLNFNLDGNFPGHPSNPLLPESQEEISRAIKREEAAAGFIFDGDADRVFLIDEKGEITRGDVTLLFLAKHFLINNPKSAIVYNLICSKAVPEFIEQWGGRPIRSPVGYVNIRKLMRENRAIMGGELSGHYSFRENFYSDSGFAAFLVLLELISNLESNVSEVKKSFSPYFNLPEINFKVQDKKRTLEEIKKKYADGEQDYLDGLTVRYQNWWFNLRPSNTEPVLRLRIEADTKEILEQKKKELTSEIERS